MVELILWIVIIIISLLSLTFIISDKKINIFNKKNEKQEEKKENDLEGRVILKEYYDGKYYLVVFYTDGDKRYEVKVDEFKNYDIMDKYIDKYIEKDKRN